MENEKILYEIRKMKNTNIKDFYTPIISSQYAYRIEKGKQKISQERLYAILERLNISPEAFEIIKGCFKKRNLEQQYHNALIFIL